MAARRRDRHAHRRVGRQVRVVADGGRAAVAAPQQPRDAAEEVERAGGACAEAAHPHGGLAERGAHDEATEAAAAAAAAAAGALPRE
eukprot:scaffold7769_cov68-Phaeocystis_antarctica.AAC.2